RVSPQTFQRSTWTSPLGLKNDEIEGLHYLTDIATITKNKKYFYGCLRIKRANGEEMEPRSSRLALTFIFITMLVDTIGLGIIIPVSPRLISSLTHEGMSGAARWGGMLIFVFGLMQFLCAPAIGNLSDRFGRRPVLIISLIA